MYGNDNVHTARYRIKLNMLCDNIYVVLVQKKKNVFSKRSCFFLYVKITYRTRPIVVRSNDRVCAFDARRNDVHSSAAGRLLYTRIFTELIPETRPGARSF